MIILDWAEALWAYILLTAPYLLIGFVASGIIHQYLNLNVIKKHLASKGLGSVIKASLFGVPLPLCSCSVIPAAVTLKKEGASNGATSAFLISTPESGVDSMVMTYGVMDLPMTIIRPIAAFLTAFIAGWGQGLWNTETALEEEAPKTCCSKEKTEEGPSIKGALKFAFEDLSDDLATWLFIGLFVGALMNLYLPMELFENVPGWAQKLVVLSFGIPFYICASASTPIAASMMIKGMSPGTALIFLLVGPATNFTNIAVLQKYIGKKGVVINVVAIALVSLVLSVVVDYAYEAFSWPTVFKIEDMHDAHNGVFSQVMGVFLSLLILKGIYKEKIKPRLGSNKSASCH